MKETSLILRNRLLVTVEEFRILNRYSYTGNIWTLIYRSETPPPYKVFERTVEYIFDPEALLIFHIVSNNILATWNTEITRGFGPNDELEIKDSLFIKPHIKTNQLTP